jgi:hypothetical protein
MSQITIQCRLIASQPTRQQIWMLMAERNTPLINELLMQMSQHPDFESWRQKGKLPAGVVKKLCEPLKSDRRFIGQPARFYTSAITLVEYIYKSWLKLRQRLQSRLEGQRRWLQMLKSDAELAQENNCSIEDIHNQAADLLDFHKSQNQPNQQFVSLSRTLFNAYNSTEDIVTRNLICYLLKKGCKLSTKPEDAEKFAQRRRKTEIRIARILEQLEGSIPKGRDLTGEKWLETLITATATAPVNEAQARSWQDLLLTEPKSIPFPVAYETNEDLSWRKDSQGRLCVHFNGLGEHTFEIYCDQRQLKYFQRFYEDQEIKRASKDQHSSALFTLRSGRVGWTLGVGKGNPWDIHHLTLYCTFDTRLWTAEGTEQVRQEKASEIAQILTKMNKKGDLNEKQQAFIKRKNSTLTRINNSFPRPSKPLYEGQSHILIGVAIGLDKPATVAVVDGITGKAIVYRSVKQLLPKKDKNKDKKKRDKRDKLLNHQRTQKRISSHQRHKAQQNDAFNKFGDSELGQYVDRLLAKAIISLARTYNAGSIVLPKLGDKKEIVQSEIQARAEAKIPGCIEKQEEYAKGYRVQVQEWSYGRLIDNIKVQASKLGILIEQGQQPIRGSPQEKAKEMALLAYQSRSKS